MAEPQLLSVVLLEDILEKGQLSGQIVERLAPVSTRWSSATTKTDVRSLAAQFRPPPEAPAAALRRVTRISVPLLIEMMQHFYDVPTSVKVDVSEIADD